MTCEVGREERRRRRNLRTVPQSVPLRHSWSGHEWRRNATSAIARSGIAIWWIQNWWEWNSSADGRPINKYQQFYSSGKDNRAMITMSNHSGNAYITLAQELITAKLVKHWYDGSGVASVDAAMAGAEAYFASQPAGIQSPSGATKTQLLAWAATLDVWTDGRLATKVCRGSCR
ncbi:MAG: hypothetical protein ABI910_09215 [Gemmatimonadota bacterium]